MARPVTLFTGQWTDLPFREICQLAKKMGYDGLEIAGWGDHLDVQKAATDLKYVEEKKKVLAEFGLKCWTISNHLAGQCVGDWDDPRLAAFVPAAVGGGAQKTRDWAIQQMKWTAQAAKNMGVSVVTGFVGSSIWKYFYSFPPNNPETIEKGYKTIVRLWSPIFDVFDECGVKFALEVHPGEIAYDYWSTKKLFEVFKNRKTLGINFDPSHLIWQGVDPALFFRDFAAQIYHVHMKDCAVKLDGRTGILGSHLPFGDSRRGWNFVSLGHGDVDFDLIIREANAAGYQGPLSVEWEDNGMDRVFGATESLAFVRNSDFAPSKVAFDASMNR
jgi:sugar phosphate isomerase/epimerase